MMGKHKKVTCEICYKEIRSDVKTRHIEQHSNGEEPNSATNTYKTNNYNTTPGVSTERKDEENEIKDEEFTNILTNFENEYQKKLVQCKKIYKKLGATLTHHD